MIDADLLDVGAAPPRAQAPPDPFDLLDRAGRGVAEASTSHLAPSRDHRLLPYALLAFGSLAMALVIGEAAVVALGVPFVIALAVGLRRRGPAEVRARIELDGEEVLEGDRLSGRLSLTWDPALEANILLHRLKGVVLEEPASGAWAVPAGVGKLVVPLSLRATQWGRHSVVELWVQLGSPLSFLSWTGRVLNGPILRVLPASERLTRLLDPAQSRAVLGAHRSVRLGEGHDFAELRPYSPGDRLRDLNWRATARQRRPFVNQRHPELSGDVVILIDAFADGSAGATQALTRAARAAWAIASVHLQANDRVGLASIGGGTHWLPPAGGRRAKYRLLQTLLSIGGDVADRTIASTPLRIAVPPSALVFALTPLQSPRFINALETWRARGRSVVAVFVDTRDLVAPPTSSAEAYARRLWSIEIEGRMRSLGDIGIPVVTLHEQGTIGQIISALRRARRAPTVRRRYA